MTTTRSYDYAVIRRGESDAMGGAVKEVHANGTVTILLGGMLPVRGLCISWVPRNDGQPGNRKPAIFKAKKPRGSATP